MRRGRIQFGLAFLILASSAGLMQVAKSQGWLQLIKGPLPIRKPLAQFDREALGRYRVVSVDRLKPEIVEELGTEEYLEWMVRHRGSRDTEWLTGIGLSVSYYTGKQDQIPHVPEECYVQGAFTIVGDETVEGALDGLGRTIPIRRLKFAPPKPTGMNTYVYYTICVNGDYYAGRTWARARMADSSESHLYYAKIQVAFRGGSDDVLGEMDEKACELLDLMLAELVERHFPPQGSERGGTANAAG